MGRRSVRSAVVVDVCFVTVCLLVSTVLFCLNLARLSNNFEDFLGLSPKALEEEELSRQVRSLPDFFPTRSKDKTSLREGQKESCTNTSCSKPFSEKCMSYQQITWYLEELARTNVHNVELISFMSTNENRKIHMVIVKPYRQRYPRNVRHNAEKLQIWLEGGFEGNNCLHTATLLQIIDGLATSCEIDCNNDYNIIPLVNPDGYEFAMSENGNWVKNREFDFKTGCAGVDLNRNFPPVTVFYKYGSNNPCSEKYRGRAPALSAEVSTVIGLKLSRGNINLTLTLIGSGNMITYPFAINTSTIPDVDKYREVSRSYALAVKAEGGPDVTFGSYGEVVGVQSGTSMDFWHDHELTEYCFTAKLRSIETTDLASLLKKSTAETIAGLNAMIVTVKSHTI